jgi:hypothetical protein
VIGGAERRAVAWTADLQLITLAGAGSVSALNDGHLIVGLSSLPGSSLTHAAMWTLRLSGAG